MLLHIVTFPASFGDDPITVPAPAQDSDIAAAVRGYLDPEGRFGFLVRADLEAGVVDIDERQATILSENIPDGDAGECGECGEDAHPGKRCRTAAEILAGCAPPADYTARFRAERAASIARHDAQQRALLSGTDDATDDPCPFAEMQLHPDVIAYQAAAEARAAAEAAKEAAADRARKSGQIRAGSRKVGDRRFVGVVRRGRAAIVECGHEHTNRDWSTDANGRSATDCARQIIDGARNQHTAEHNATRIRDAWTKLTGPAGFVFPTSALPEAKAASAKAADAYLAAVATLRALPNL